MEGGIEKRTYRFTRALESSDQKLLEDLLIFADDQELSEIIGSLKSNGWILPRVCQLGFLEVLQRIHDFQLIDIDAEYMGRTGLQYACQEGHVDIVTWLLHQGASPKKSLWKEDSEFYLATLNGNQDIINLLLSRQPDLAPDMSVCYCLMYAACLGGHLTLVKKWFAPGMNVRETIAFTTDLNNCEHKYPLFAACQGEHFEVALFLIKECGAAITEDICQHFPEFTTRLVRLLFLVSDTEHLLEFYMADYKIECILPCWFNAKKRSFETECSNSKEDEDEAEEEEENMYETVIDVKENRLRVLPDGVLWALRELTFLDASYNPLRTIYDAVDPSLLTLSQLKTLNLSHCELESLSSHIFALPCLEQLNLSYNRLTSLDQKEENGTYRSSDWKCTRLQSLDVSHNLLTSFPSGIQSCAKLTTLIASYNQFTTACTPWQCSMKILDLSNNKLTTFAPNADQYWKKTLSRLSLQSNQFTELTESIVKMSLLTYLDVSNNKIQRMPPPNLWCCPLIFLNLSDNQLGIGRLSTPLQKVISLNSTPVPQLEFPKQCLASTLMELFMANNGLKAVPIGISDLERLSVLDLSENTQISELPYELGKLKKLLNLKLSNITVKDKDLQKLISSLDSDTHDVYASDVITYLERKRRNCVLPGIQKLVVLGCKTKNAPCIVQKLVKSKDVSTHDHKNLSITRMTSKQKKSLTFEIWEFPDSKITFAILPCFLTSNSLYIIVHDVCYGGSDLLSVSEKMASIQACDLHAKIIVVCTYSTSMEKSARVLLEKEIMMKTCGFPKAKFISVTLGPRENVDSLHQEIFSAWETMNAATFDKNVKSQQRQVPKMFLDVINNVKKLQHNICRMEDFLKAVGITRKDLEDGVDENMKLHEFLIQVGAILHYNIHMDELSDCVILNPMWLFEVFSKFLKSLITVNDTKIAQLPISDVRAIIQKELPTGDYDYFPALLKLLENFHIGMRMTIKKDEVLLVPSLLPKRPLEFQFDSHKDACKAARLYTLPAISPFLWSHMISQLILAFERFSTSKWKLGEQKSNASVNLDRTKSFRMGCSTSLKGLNIYNKNIQYWRTGITMHYDQGHVVVEQVACTSSTAKKPTPGILVTVQTTGSLQNDSDLDHLSENTKKLSVMGVVRDELEEVLEFFNPMFRHPFEAQLRQIYALCPLCYNIRPGSGCVDLDQIHFNVRDCAQMLLSKDLMKCSKGPTLLVHLVPEFLFLELPPELHLLSKDIVLSDVKLGRGMAGAVTKATFKGTDVAVKIFHDSSVRPLSDNENGSLYPNVGAFYDKNKRSNFTKQEEDDIETEQIKITNAFSEVRREVGILSKLKHEFIVTFIGLCVRPQLLLVMELAPLGSLRKELEKRIKTLHELEHQDTVISQTIFSKDLTYKIIFQIGSGLSYLHKNNVIYRDLKPDNILAFSFSVDDRVNIKLSDYGISKFATLQGVTGLLGTAGYMAPEIVSKQPYTEQVDIYSYAIVMLEVLTGLSPSEQLHKPCWSHDSNSQTAPSQLQGRRLHCNFPYLENLMEECWSKIMDERPTAENVVKRMKADQFLLLHDSVWLDKSFPEKLEVTCIYACQTFGRWNIWICESGYSDHRYFSVYDVMSCSFTIYRQECHGPQVTDMTKVGSRIWVVCKELGNLQVIVRGIQNKFEVCHGVHLEASATKILSHTFGTSEESESFILVGLEDGCVTAYNFNTYHRKSMTVITNIEFNRGIPIAQMCSVSSSVIAIACGMSVYLLHVELHNSQGTDMTSKKGVFIPDLINHGSVSLKNVRDVYEPIVCMVSEGNAVWCSLENSCYLVKVDVDSRKIMLVLTLSWELSRDTVILEEIDSKSSSNSRQEEGFGHHSNNVGDDVFEESSDKSRRTAGCKNDTSQKQSDSGSEHSENHKPPLPPRINPAFMRNADKPPPVPKRQLCREIHAASLALSVDTLIVGTNCSGIILLPLIYKNNSDKSGSLPKLPFHLPVLRHPSKKKECGRRTRSLTASNSDQFVNCTGSVSALTVADDKIVSLHKIQQLVLRGCSKNRPKVTSKREGSVFTAETVDMSTPPFLSTDENSFNNTDQTDSNGPTSELPQSSDITQFAEIAVWDNVAQERLKIIRSYSHDLFNCFGWCCHAPESAASDDEFF